MSDGIKGVSRRGRPEPGRPRGGHPARDGHLDQPSEPIGADLNGRDDELDWLRTAVHAAGDVVYDWDLASDTIRWSPNAREVFGLPPAVDIDNRPAFVSRINCEDEAALRHFRGECGGPVGDRGERRFRLEYRVRGRDGHFCWADDRGVVCHGEDGRPRRVVGAIRIVTDLKQAEAESAWLHAHDALTGHYNRDRLRDALSHAVAFADRYDTPGAFLVVAINDLADTHDAYGAAGADAAVVAVGRALDGCLRQSDIVGRIAPDRFGVVVTHCPPSAVPIMADKLIAAIERASARTAEGPIHLTVAIGAASFPTAVQSAHEAMVKAEVAVEQARRTGPNAFVAYDLSEAQQARRRSNLITAKAIQAALQNDRLQLAYQPVVRAHDHSVAFHECLLRLRRDDGTCVPAGSFLGVAEEVGLIRVIDRRVIEMAVAQLFSAPETRLAVNVSGLTTNDAAWLRLLRALLDGHPETAARLTLEITETAALHDIEETMRFVSAVRDLGCRVALDDFGAGYTSFRHLKALAVNIVKIDGSFITNLARQPKDLLFVRTLKDLAHGFGLEVVAECVETAEVGELLTREGIDYLQGYHFGRPSLARPWDAPAARRVHA